MGIHKWQKKHSDSNSMGFFIQLPAFVYGGGGIAESLL